MSIESNINDLWISGTRTPSQVLAFARLCDLIIEKGKMRYGNDTGTYSEISIYTYKGYELVYVVMPQNGGVVDIALSTPPFKSRPDGLRIEANIV